ncbi:hypothetical protein OVA24_09240 [Luteolibacter sp. SL250]|uniref:hypothetical protein n=1 Tax=Luteolibacter sp. SL250 TaxID=2995170 RepID=UPI0022717FBA|nr:hypothetical protein [Luteolibacter sp. SL250]WAC21567.1 hypothetical protein OVA24_09240 [Luteolibacter sp. SL250]
MRSIIPILLCGCLPVSAAKKPTAGGAPVQAPVKPANDQFPAKPLRLVGASVEEFVQNAVPNLAISTREFDPFGMPQDPDYRPPAPPPTAVADNTPQSAPFADIIRRIQITTVMTGDKKFLVGSRSFSAGDRFPVNFEGQSIWIEVVEVSAHLVQFKNVQTGETAAQSLNLLPPGMTPGSGGISAPGMVPTNQQAPLDLNTPGSAPAPPTR